MKSNEENDSIENEVHTGHKPIPTGIISKVENSICKITFITKDNKLQHGTGFFLKVSDSLKYLITNYHVINPNNINANIELEINNKKKMKLETGNRIIKFFENPRDITIIEIKNYDDIYKYIEFLDYDKNYIDNGYNIYKKVDVFSVEHPLGGVAACASGIIVNINNYEFEHNISTDYGSSGSPIMLLNNNMNILQVIGIHKSTKRKNKINYGTFIGEIFKEINDNMVIRNNENYIIAEFIIKDGDIYQDIRIINSYEESMREIGKEIRSDYMNEEEIKKFVIKINSELIPFNYFHKFEDSGKYIIKYILKDNLTNMSFIFNKCSSLTNINLSNFNTQDVNNMGFMFCKCSSLTNINLSNFNTQNVIHMSWMFSGCSSLKNLNLENFSTQNVKDMFGMFNDCSSLKNLNLDNFNTQKVTDMNNMFKGCTSLMKENVITKDYRIKKELGISCIFF